MNVWWDSWPVPEADRDCRPEDQYEEVMSEVIEFHQRLIAEIRGVDKLINYSAMLLRIGQPPRAGKFDVRWWKTSSSDFLMPVLVRWMKISRGEKAGQIGKPVPVTRVHARMFESKGSGAINVKFAMRVVSEVQGLIETRRRLLKLLTMFRKPARHTWRLSGHSETLNNSASLLLDLHKAIVTNLDQHGYLVEDHYRPELFKVT